MKRLFFILILTLSFQTLTKADDIRDFQIEGMSIGDSLLDHFNKELIETNADRNSDEYKSNAFIDIEISDHTNFNTYQSVQIAVKSNDKKYIIHGIDGIKSYDNNIKLCLKDRKDIIEELFLLFNNADKYDRKRISHPSYANSFTTDTFLTLISGDAAVISCYDFSKDISYVDQLRVSMWSKELNEWLIR